MSLSRWYRLAGATGLLALVCLLPVQATILPLQQPVALRFATADSVVIGKVTGFEQKPVAAGRFAGDKNKTDYTVAIVKIEEGFGHVANIKRIETVRVGFIPRPAVQPLPPVILPPNPPPGAGAAPQPVQPQPVLRPATIVAIGHELAKDQEVVLFLTPHHEGNFSIFANFGGVVIKDKENPQAFNTTVEEVKHAAKLLANPKAGLEAKNGDDRLITAAMLLSRYRTPQGGGANPKQEPIDAAESKAILTVLADADWANQNPNMRLLHPQSLFFRLGLTAQDGWTQPKDFQQLSQAAKQWLKDNADKYRIKRYVAAEKEKSDK